MARKRKQKTGNKSSWGDKEVIKVVNEMIKDAQDNPTVNTLMSICARADINQDCIKDWERKFENNPPVLRSIKKLRKLMEARLLERALNNEINAGFTKFLLKSKFGYDDQPNNLTVIKSDKINISFDDNDDDEDE